MPKTKKGQKIMRAMKAEYGPERGERIYHASAAKGTIKGVEKAKHNPGGKSGRKVTY